MHRDVRLGEEQIARQSAPLEVMEHRRAQRRQPTSPRGLGEEAGQQLRVVQPLGGDLVEVDQQVPSDHG